jgi:hypothetical protein
MAHATAADLMRLDWRDFSAGRFPERRLHDLEALKAYEAYVNGRPPLTGERTDVDGTSVWENEGGAFTCPR